MNTFADGALYVSIHDMIKWEKGLNSKKILKDQASFDQMWSAVTLNDDTTYPYGFGWEIDETIGRMYVVKDGGTWQGFQSFIIRVLGVNVTVVAFANLDHADADQITSHVLQMYNPQFALVSREDE